jgi:hypothetical protein
MVNDRSFVFDNRSHLLMCASHTRSHIRRNEPSYQVLIDAKVDAICMVEHSITGAKSLTLAMVAIAYHRYLGARLVCGILMPPHGQSPDRLSICNAIVLNVAILLDIYIYIYIYIMHITISFFGKSWPLRL